MPTTLQEALRQVEERVNSVVIDQRAAVRHVLLAIACGGHVLIEDVPGMGKTTLAEQIAQVLGLSFKRIQGTADMLPSAITGSSIVDTNAHQLQYLPSPLFSQFVLVDEINRMPPKTQSALLEAMQEGQITVDGVTHPLPRPSILMATENPIELEGTFPLPEAQLDRFFLQIRLRYPSPQEEMRLHHTWEPPIWQMSATAMQPVPTPLLSADAIFALRQTVRQIHLSREVEEYLIVLLNATRTHEHVRLGLSPRAGLMVRRAAQGWAFFNNRDHVLPDDVQAVLPVVGAHRLILHAEADLRGISATQVLQRIVEQTAVNGSWASLTSSQKERV